MTDAAGEPMVVDEGNASLVCPTLTQDTDGLLHPLVILNISDHWTRTKVQTVSKQGQPVFGALLGRHEGRHLEIINSFELRMFEKAGLPTINPEFLPARALQYKEVFPELDVIGWYTTGEGSPTAAELSIHKYVNTVAESAVFLKLDTKASEGNCTKLPVSIWENAGTESHLLRAIPWTLVSEESERIGVEHVNRFSSRVGTGKDCEVSKTIRSNNNAVSMLVTRVKVIRDYLAAVAETRLPPNNDIIREANKLCQLVTRLSPQQFSNSSERQEEDVNVAVLLAKMTEMSGAMNELLSRVITIASDRSPGAVSKANLLGQMPPKKYIYTTGPLHGGPDLFSNM